MAKDIKTACERRTLKDLYRPIPNNPDPSDRIGIFGFQSEPKRIGMDRGNPEILGHTWLVGGFNPSATY